MCWRLAAISSLVMAALLAMAAAWGSWTAHHVRWSGSAGRLDFLLAESELAIQFTAGDHGRSWRHYAYAAGSGVRHSGILAHWAWHWRGFSVIDGVTYLPGRNTFGARSWSLAAPCWFFWLLTALFSVPIGVRWWRPRRRSRRGLCPHCGYDLRGSPGRCPECGQEPKLTVAQRSRATFGAAMLLGASLIVILVSPPLARWSGVATREQLVRRQAREVSLAERAELLRRYEISSLESAARGAEAIRDWKTALVNYTYLCNRQPSNREARQRKLQSIEECFYQAIDDADRGIAVGRLESAGAAIRRAEELARMNPDDFSEFDRRVFQIRIQRVTTAWTRAVNAN